MKNKKSVKQGNIVEGLSYWEKGELIELSSV